MMNHREWHYTRKYPILWKGEWLYEKDCGSVFASIYSSKESLILPDTKCYIGDGSFVFPDDTLSEGVTE
jgi:hypothetical protein